jgi:hypothetical protein
MCLIDWYVSHSTAPRIVIWLGKGNNYFLCYSLWFVLWNGDGWKSHTHYKQGYRKVVGNGTVLLIHNLARSNQYEKQKIFLRNSNNFSKYVWWKVTAHPFTISIINQCFSTAGTQPSTGPWHQLYRTLVL